jgi:hypothetical protein
MSAAQVLPTGFIKSQDGKFDRLKNWEKLPESFKKHIKKEDKWKTGEVEEKALAELTQGKIFQYGVSFWEDAEIFSVWARERGPGEQPGQQRSNFPKRPTEVPIDFETTESSEHAKYLLNSNANLSDKDPIWRHITSHVLRKHDGADILVHVLQKVKKVW